VDGKLLYSFFAYGGDFHGGVYVAVGDVNGDGRADIITGVGPGGGPHVRVFNGATGTLLTEFFAYGANFHGGVSVAAGDVNGDGKAEIITGAGPGGGPHVQVFDGVTHAVLRSFFAYDGYFHGGVYVAAADVDGDGRADVITGPGAGGGPHVKVFGGRSGGVLTQFFAFGQNFRGGVRVAAVDLNGDGREELITGAGPGGGPVVSVRDGHTLSLLDDFTVTDPTLPGGIFVG
jgi:hypothetical protein